MSDGIPTSSRSDTRSKIIDVAARLLREEGPAAVTTRGVAEHAGVQAPTIYRLFGDKDGLLDTVAEHVMATYVAAKAAIVAAASAGDVDPLDDLRAGWDMQIDFGVANPALFRLLSDPDRVRRSPAAQSGMRVLESRVHRVAATGRLRISERRAVELIHAAGTGTITTILATPIEERDPGLADEMLEAVLRQILTDAPAPARSSAMAATVAFRAIAPRLDMLSGAERHLLRDWLDRAIDALEVSGGK
jgi:AcrR family transcriptional regulator